jgi:hypothetical protein
MIAERISSARAIAIGFFAKGSGSGKPHIRCPIEIYISERRKTKDDIRRKSIDFSSFSKLFSSDFRCTGAELSGAAPYPAARTAEIISASSPPLTVMEFVRRFTEQLSTPETDITARSTLAEQAAQLIPVTLNFFIFSPYQTSGI